MVTSRRTTAYLRDLLKNNKELRQKYIDSRNVEFPMLPTESMQLLRLIVKLKQPLNILEIGTNIGYSGITMLKAAPMAKLYTIEMDINTANIAKNNMKLNGVYDRATVYIGKAEEIIPFVTGKYDIIFLDGPKGQYLNLSKYLIPLLNDNGLFVCDNVLFRGMITGDRKATKRKSTLCRKLDDFLKEISNNSNLITSVVPIGDGMSISYLCENNIIGV